MPYNFAAERFHTKQLCSSLSSIEVHFLNVNRPFCVFEPPPLGHLGTTYDDHLRLIGKRVVEVPISVN